MQLAIALVGTLASLAAAIAAWLVVPEFRRRLGLPAPEDSTSPAVRRLGRISREVVRKLTEPHAVPDGRHPGPDAPTGWAVLLTDGCWTHGIPGELCRRLRAARKGDQPVKQFAFRPASNGWVILQGPNGYQAQGIPDNLQEELERANRTGKEIELVAFDAADAWLLLLGDEKPIAHRVPYLLQDRLHEYRQRQLPIKQVALGPGRSWVVLLGRNGFRERRTPKSLYDKLEEYNRGGEEIKQVVLLPSGDWLVLYGKNSFCASGLPAAAVKLLKRCRDHDTEILSVCFTWFGKKAG